MSNEELADALMALEFCRHSPKVIEAAQALRDMPEGERIEVFVDPDAFRVAQEHKAEARSFEIPTWTFPQVESHQNATLVLHAQEGDG